MRKKNLPMHLLTILVMMGFSVHMKAQTFIVTGSYIGNKTDNTTISHIGFQSDVIIIKGNESREAIIRIGTMTGDLSKRMHSGSHVANRVQSVNSDGFVIGDDDDVNKDNIEYYYTCIKNQAGKFTTGTYVGDGAGSKSITGLGFTPDFVILMSDADDEIIFKSVDMSGQLSCDIANSCSTGDRIKSLDSDGFSVANNADVNGNGKTYHYIAGKNTNNAIKVGSYSGDATSNRAISDVQFQPKFLLVKNQSTEDGVFRSDAIAGDHTFKITANAPAGNLIKTITSSGFTLGADNKVNKSSTLNYYLALNDNGTPLAAHWINFVVSRNNQGKVQASWVVTHPQDVLAYTLERSTDNKTFKEIASLPALSGNESQIQYNLDDENSPSTITWYRVKETLADGSSNYSSVAAVTPILTQQENLHITLYPNPSVNQKFTVSMNLPPSPNTELRVYDSNGKLILFQNWTGKTTGEGMEVVFPEGLAKGVYFVEVCDQDLRVTERIRVE